MKCCVTKSRVEIETESFPLGMSSCTRLTRPLSDTARDCSIQVCSQHDSGIGILSIKIYRDDVRDHCG